MITKSFLILSFLIIKLFESSCAIQFVSRKDWGAVPAQNVDKLLSIPKYVFVHHSLTTACNDYSSCIKTMQAIQNSHMNERKWSDIGYSFAIGSDGRVYVGRGWDIVGAHTNGYNSVGLGFVVIGDYRFNVPNDLTLNTLKKLIEYGVTNNKIDKNYILRGHRDMVKTECPGQAFYDLIKKWPHY